MLAVVLFDGDTESVGDCETVTVEVGRVDFVAFDGLLVKLDPGLSLAACESLSIALLVGAMFDDETLADDVDVPPFNVVVVGDGVEKDVKDGKAVDVVVTLGTCVCDVDGVVL